MTIVRPSHTYGETKLVVGPTMGWQVSHWTLVDRVLRGKPVVVHDTGRSRWTVTHSDDVAVGIVGLLGNRAAVGNLSLIHIWMETACEPECGMRPGGGLPEHAKKTLHTENAHT